MIAIIEQDRQFMCADVSHIWKPVARTSRGENFRKRITLIRLNVIIIICGSMGCGPCTETDRCECAFQETAHTVLSQCRRPSGYL